MGISKQQLYAHGPGVESIFDARSVGSLSKSNSLRREGNGRLNLTDHCREAEQAIRRRHLARERNLVDDT